MCTHKEHTNVFARIGMGMSTKVPQSEMTLLLNVPLNAGSLVAVPIVWNCKGSGEEKGKGRTSVKGKVACGSIC